MRELLQGLLQKAYAYLVQFITDLLGEEVILCIKRFIKNQSLELLKGTELVAGFDDITYFVNKSSAEHGVLIEKLEKIPDGSVHIIATHEEHGKINLTVKIHEFTLSRYKSFIKFSYNIKDITAPTQSSISYKIKIFAANMALQFFPDTITKKAFDKKDFGQEIKSVVSGNSVIIDFHPAIKQTILDETFLDYTILDFLQIIAINTHKNGLGIKFNVNIPDWVQSLTIITFSALVHRKFSWVPVPAPQAHLMTLFKKFI